MKPYTLALILLVAVCSLLILAGSLAELLVVVLKPALVLAGI